jgi:exopolysaccharide biosynthesis WecB/TagA/CpsF family protein
LLQKAFAEKAVSAKNKKTIREELLVKVIEGICLLNSQKEAGELVESFRKKNKPVILSFVNSHAFNICYGDTEFTNALLKSDIIFRDGIGMQILYNSLGKKPGANLNGSDFIPLLIENLKGKRIALLGSGVSHSLKAAKKLIADGHQIVLAESGFHPTEHYLNLIKQIKPEVIILGMGMPKQEKLSILLRECIDNSCLIINGGAIIDLWGEKIRRAPLWVRQLNMEWIFRLLIEPRRLFTRYVIGNYVFLKRIKIFKNMTHPR